MVNDGQLHSSLNLVAVAGCNGCNDQLRLDLLEPKAVDNSSKRVKSMLESQQLFT